MSKFNLVKSRIDVKWFMLRYLYLKFDFNRINVVWIMMIKIAFRCIITTQKSINSMFAKDKWGNLLTRSVKSAENSFDWAEKQVSITSVQNQV